MTILARVMRVKGAMVCVGMVEPITRLSAIVLMGLTLQQIVSSYHLITRVLEMVSRIVPYYLLSIVALSII